MCRSTHVYLCEAAVPASGDTTKRNKKKGSVLVAKQRNKQAHPVHSRDKRRRRVRQDSLLWFVDVFVRLWGTFEVQRGEI